MIASQHRFSDIIFIQRRLVGYELAVRDDTAAVVVLVILLAQQQRCSMRFLGFLGAIDDATLRNACGGSVLPNPCNRLIAWFTSVELRTASVKT
ncbi:hypothetical protein LNP74_19590 [Klebsiella pneumoniae subsp. pneumoniae]|nr:hypothetical protein [Klebsiella pneumoniae subsp. pneumoniae]